MRDKDSREKDILDLTLQISLFGQELSYVVYSVHL